jgi:Ca-activated chloride channel family protein
MRIERPDDTRAQLTLAAETVPADRDLELRWTPQSGAAPSAALFSETVAGEEFLVLMVTPPAGVDAVAPVSREVVFVLDTSGSMAGESIRQARSSLLFALDRLKPGDRFNVIEFNSTHRALFPASVSVTETTRSQAKGFVATLEAQGGTNMLPALDMALRDEDAALRGLGAKAEVRQVIFLTDGAIGNEQQLFETISQKRGRARVFTVGIGSAPNSFFMSRAAEVGRGVFTHIGAVDQVAARMTALFEKLESPVLRDLQLVAPDGAKFEAWPNPIPDVYKGEPVIVAVKSNGASGIYSISGVRGEAGWRADIPSTKASRRAGASKLWARRKIASLELDIARDWTAREQIEQEILKTALTHSLVSRLTSIVAVDVTPLRTEEAAIATAAAPLNFPAGWEFDKVFGKQTIRLQREADVGAPAEIAALRLRASEDDAAPALAGQAGAEIALPQGATLADVKIGFGLFLILLAMAVFLTHSSACARKMTGARP